ncbi:MAG: SGNH/GDSL hydrolase family protein, partial [bacterium]
PADAYNLELFRTDTLKIGAEKISSNVGDCYQLDELRTSLCINGIKAPESKSNYTIQGILLENSESRGVLYSATAVNGATYSTFNKSQDFFKQVNAMEPDLVILSLGTNDIASVNMSAVWVLGVVC